MRVTVGRPKVCAVVDERFIGRMENRGDPTDPEELEHLAFSPCEVSKAEEADIEWLLAGSTAIALVESAALR